MSAPVSVLPSILYEDEHILVVNKPAGINTHSPNPCAGEGIYEWLKNQEPRWADLAIIHRLDKTTSGLILFAKSRLASQSLTQQFAKRRVKKRYLLLSAHAPPRKRLVARCRLARVGDRYLPSNKGELAETVFEDLGPAPAGFHMIAANPLTGRTHQIRVHAQMHQFPILGDSLYGGAPFPRVCLHANELSFRHPETARALTFNAQVDFHSDPSFVLRRELITSHTNAFRLIHAAADHAPDLFVDVCGTYLLAQTEAALTASQKARLHAINLQFKTAGTYLKTLSKQVRRATLEEAAPVLIDGAAAPASFEIQENGVFYHLSFEQGYSVGLFFDQRENRRRILRNYIAPGFQLFAGGLEGREILNTFAYTCAFSVCAALAGARTTSLDLSRKYLEWGKRNFTLNHIDPERHDFIYGDVFDWAARLAKRNRQFDLLLVDPPTFSHARSGTLFQAEKHYGRLVSALLPLLRPNGILFASTNAHRLKPGDFLAQVAGAIEKSGRKILQQHYVPQPFDFPISREQPAYLKTVWLRAG